MISIRKGYIVLKKTVTKYYVHVTTKAKCAYTPVKQQLHSWVNIQRKKTCTRMFIIAQTGNHSNVYQQ